MKIQSFLFFDTGPLGTQKISLENDWEGKIESKILFSGPNGCGKSTVLRTVAVLWDALGYWLDYRKPLPQSHASREWLQRWGGCAIILDNVPHYEGQVGLIFGDLTWTKNIREQYSNVKWIGESVDRNGKPGQPRREIFIPEEKWLDCWSIDRKRMILSFDKVEFPNIVFLDAEERRWVQPKRNVGEPKADDNALRWLPRYIVSEDWKGQLEASLITLKTTQLHLFHEIIRSLNNFLSGKSIDPDIKTGENRLRVRIKGQRGLHHSLDELSAGEHQVLIMIYLLARWAEQGCIILIDEPDLYLHPSLVSSLLASIEHQVRDKKGQLLITSHLPDIWHRYEASGKRIELGDH